MELVTECPGAEFMADSNCPSVFATKKMETVKTIQQNAKVSASRISRLEEPE
jgi:hypothetical protein